MRGNTVALSAFCVVIATTAVVSASASATTKSSKSSTASRSHIPKNGGMVNLTAYSDNDGPTSDVVLTGVIGDYGHAVRMSTSGSRQDDELQLALSRGSFRLDISGVEGKLEKALGTDFPTNTATCSGFESVTGTAPIMSGSSTGAYTGLQGTFHLTVSVNEVASAPCPENDTSPYLAQTVFISGVGLVSLK
jgi:hypothetical protein